MDLPTALTVIDHILFIIINIHKAEKSEKKRRRGKTGAAFKFLPINRDVCRTFFGFLNTEHRNSLLK